VSGRPPLEAVVFDAGGTLVRLDFEWISRMLAGLGVAAPVDSLRRAEIHGRLAYDAAAAPGASPGSHEDPGVSTLAPIQVYWGGMLEAAGCPRGVLDEALRRMDERQKSSHFLWAQPMEGARGALDALAAAGLRLGCVSNSDGRAEEHLVRFGLRDGLEFVIDSAHVGVEKPDPRIFALAFARLELPADRTLYVGDFRSVDERGSRAAGMAFVLLDPFGTYARGGTATIAAIADLPAFVGDHFTTPGRQPRQAHPPGRPSREAAGGES
jgi:HAD superfamily hydrolase (TIGR01509 family)